MRQVKHFQWREYTFRGAEAKIIYPVRKVYANIKEFAPLESQAEQFFHFEVNPYSEEKANRKSHKLFPLWKWRNSTRCIKSP